MSPPGVARECVLPAIAAAFPPALVLRRCEVHVKLVWRTSGRRRVFVVPEKFNRNNPAVRAMGPPAETGLRLLEHMCQRIGISSLAGLDVLDFGCGSRFADAIVTRNVA